MRITFRGGLAAALTISATLLSACSDYPDNGTIDTSALTENATVANISGRVYGITPGVKIDLAEYEHDRRVLTETPEQRWEAHKRGDDFQEVNLIGSGTFDFPGYLAAIDEAINLAEQETDERVARAVAKKTDERSSLLKQIDTIAQAGASYRALVDDAEARLATAEENLEAAMQAYRVELNTPRARLNKIAENAGLASVPDHRNPARTYREINYRNKPLPDECPQRSGFTAIDLRYEQDRCVYIQIPGAFGRHAEEIAEITRSTLLKLPGLKDAIGEQTGWRDGATGAYAMRDDAKLNYREEIAAARSKFGGRNQREGEQAFLNQKIDALDEELVEMRNNEFRETLRQSVPIEMPTNQEVLAYEYIESARDNLLEHVVKGPKIAFKGVTPSFEGLESGYIGAVVVANISLQLVDKQELVTSLQYIDLTDESIRDAGKLMVKVAPATLKAGQDVAFYDPDSVNEAIIHQLSTTFAQQDPAEPNPR